MSYLVTFMLSLAWFAFFQSWGSFHDPDAFFHAKIASLMAAQGPLKTFPWLDLTSLGHDFADQHFLFHVLLFHFERVFGMLGGTQIAAVVFASLFVTIFYFVVRKLEIRRPWFWTVLLSISTFLIVRLSLGKASPLALIWLVLGMFAILKKKPWLGIVAGLGFALSHGGWIVLLACQTLYLVGEIAFAKVVEDHEWKKVLAASSWKVLFSTLAGIIFGMVIHPNFPANLSFLWVQVVKIGLETPYHRVSLGQEWLPMPVGDLIIGLGFALLVALGIAFGFLFARRMPLDRSRAKASVALGFVVAGLVALTLKSSRAIEYLVPLFVLWLGTLAMLIDERQLVEEGRSLFRSKPLRIFVVLLLGAVFFHDVRGSKSMLQDHAYPFTVWHPPMSVLSKQALAGDRVFHSDWDFFPELFMEDDRLRYIAGLDPTFLLEANPHLSDEYVDITLGHATSSDFEKIRDDFHAKFVVIRIDRHAAFARALEEDQRFIRIYADPQVRVYRLGE